MKDAARAHRYKAERDLLVAVLTTLWPAHLAMSEKPNIGGDQVICIHSPVGQLAWIIGKPSLFAHLSTDRSCQWDGHNASQRMARLRQLVDAKEKK